MTSIPRRLMKRVVQQPNGCWEWTGAICGNGYGRAWDGARSEWVHRIFARLAFGGIEPGMQVDHLCRNKACVNPNHLQVVTPLENIMRSTGPAMTAARHKMKTHCRRGHPLFGNNLYTDKRGHRVCKTCQRKIAAKHRAKRRKPDSRLRAVECPAGAFPSLTAAAIASEVKVATASHRARCGIMGWRYLNDVEADVLLRLANEGDG